MTWTAIKYKILHPQQFDALSLHSATDLATALIHDVEEAWSQDQKASMLTLDVQDAFDAVLSDHLINQLREQAWPTKIVQWIASFTNDHTASLQLGNHASRFFKISAELSQGSPVSSILFMLFIQSIFKQGSVHACWGCFGYADDICQLVVLPSLEENCSTLQHCTEELRQWETREGLTFDFSKTELQHFLCGVN